MNQEVHNMLASLLGTVEYSVSWIGHKHEPQSDENWLREAFLPAGTAVVNIGPNAWLRSTGTYIIDVFSPLNKGRNPVETIAEELVELFPAGYTASQDGVWLRVETSYWEQPREEEVWISIPVIVEYRAEKYGG